MSPAVADAEGLGRIERAGRDHTAARPTSEWKAATSCGIAVIVMRRAMTAPMPPPMAMPTTISTQLKHIGRRLATPAS